MNSNQGTLAMLRYKLRTLLIVLALGPPMLAGVYWTLGEWLRVQATREARQTAREAQERLASLEQEAMGPRETVAGMSSAELDSKFAEIIAAADAAP
jgi:hypothetical protein